MLNTTCALEYAFILRLGTARTMSVAVVMLRSESAFSPMRRHRDADVLDVLLAALGRDDDFLDARRGRRRRRLRLVSLSRLRTARHRRQERESNRGAHIRPSNELHESPSH